MSAIQNALVRHPTCSPCIEGIKIGMEFCSHIVCIKYSNLRRLLKALSAQQLYVSVCDRKQQRIAISRSAHRLHTCTAAGSIYRMTRQIRRQLCSTADRANSRTAAAVRHCKGFMEIKVAYIRAYGTWICKTNLGIHICAIHIYLSAVAVDYIHNLPYLNLKDTVCRWIGNHKTSKSLSCSLCLLPQLIHINVSILVTTYKNYIISSHSRTGRVGAVRRGWDNHCVSAGLACSLKESLDGCKARILACSAGVWLQ